LCKIFFYMKKLSLFLFLVFTAINSWGQTTIYSQNFDGVIAPALPTGWASATWGTSATSASNIYAGATGLNNMTSNGAGTLIYNNSLSTVGYTSITVIWGARRTGAAAAVTVDWSSDGGTTWNAIAFTDVANNSIWALVNSGTSISLPVGAAGVANLEFRWTATTSNYRMDDFLVQGTPATPAITLADNGTQIAAANVTVGTTNVVLHQSSLAITTANATLTGMTCTTAGTYASADITNIKAWYSASNTFNSGTATLLSTFTTPGIAGAKTFPAFMSQIINSGSTGYIYITADVAAGATVNNTISVNALTTANFTFSSGTKSGSTTVGGTQTFIAAVVSVAYMVDEGFTAGPAALNAGFTTLTAGGVYTTGSNFGRNSPSLQFNATGQIIQYGPWAGSADEISFLYQDESGVGSTFKVEESVAGAIWTTVTNSPATTITTAATFTAPLLATSRYIRITFTKSAGNAMFDDLRIRKAGSFAGTNHINILEELINGGCGSCEGYNEFVYFETGDSALDVHFLELVNPTMTYGLGDLAMGGNGTVSTGAGGNDNTNINWILNASLTGTQTAYTSGLNTTAGCAMFTNIPASNIIPKYSKVIAFTGCCPDAPYNFSGMCASLVANGQAYVIYADEHSGCTISGKYGNTCAANCTRFLTLFNHKTGDNSNKSFTTPSPTANGDSWDFVSGTKVVTGCAFVVLSADLIEFKAEAIDVTTSKIKFTTLSEKDVKQYTISKSLDGIKYVVIDHQTSLNRQEKTNYFSYDKINRELNPIIYYRLEEEDFNGVKKIVANCLINLKPSKEIIINSNETGISIAMPLAAKSIELLSLDGKNIIYVEGNENELLFQINLEGVAKGFYLLRVTDINEKVIVKKIIH